MVPCKTRGLHKCLIKNEFPRAKGSFQELLLHPELSVPSMPHNFTPGVRFILVVIYTSSLKDFHRLVLPSTVCNWSKSMSA